MSDNNCGNCRFYQKAPHSLCRRYPPAVVVPNGSPYSPVVLRGEWCGEYKPVAYTDVGALRATILGDNE